MTPYSYLSIVIIGADVAITTVLLFGVWRALRATGRTSTDVLGVVLTLGGILFGWLAVALFLGGLTVTAGLPLHEDIFDVILDDRVGFVWLSEEF